MKCVNKSLPAYKYLVEQLGEGLAESISVQNDHTPPETLDKALIILRANKIRQMKYAVNHMATLKSPTADDLLRGFHGIVKYYDGKFFIVNGATNKDTPTPLARAEVYDMNTKFLTDLNSEFGPIFKFEGAAVTVDAIGLIKGTEKMKEGFALPTVFQEGNLLGEIEESLEATRNSNTAPSSSYVSAAVDIASGMIAGSPSAPSSVVLPYSNEPAARKLKSLIKRYGATPATNKDGKAKRAQLTEEIFKLADQVYQEFKDVVKNNLENIVKAWDPVLIERSKKWYEGANRIAQALANRYSISFESASGVIAALSPQNEWFNNINGADRVMNILKNHGTKVFSEDLFNAAIDKYAGQPFGDVVKALRQKYVGVTLNQLLEEIENLPADTERKVIRSKEDIASNMLRVMDIFISSPIVYVVSPEGQMSGIKRSGNVIQNFAWGSSNEIYKAISIFRDPSIENISRRMGRGNKVRNFYNNIANPFSTRKEVTADTHALGAAMLNVVSANDASGMGLFTNNSKGLSPLYSVVKEAYQESAENLGMLPRELQSVTWEAIRLLIKEEDKNEQNREFINGIWQQVQDKTISYDEAVRTIIGRFEFARPAWDRKSDTGGSRIDSPDFGNALNEGVSNADNIRGQQPEPGQSSTGVAESVGGVGVDYISGTEKVKYMTEDGKGNYVFYHYGFRDLSKKGIDPEKFGTNTFTGRDEKPMAPASFFYTEPEIREVGVGDFGHVVKIRKDKVYPFNEDPLKLLPEAEKLFKKLYPDMAFDFNKQVAWVSMVASEKGFDMVVADWNGVRGFKKSLRAQSPIKLMPEIFEKPVPNTMNQIKTVPGFDFKPNRKKKGLKVNPSIGELKEELTKGIEKLIGANALSLNYVIAYNNDPGGLIEFFADQANSTPSEFEGVAKGVGVDLAIRFKEYRTKSNQALSVNNTGKTQGFFSDVVAGISDKFKPKKEWVPILKFSSIEESFKSVYDTFKGNFDAHIASSIPTFRETQIKVGAAIAKIYGGLTTSLPVNKKMNNDLKKVRDEYVASAGVSGTSLPYTQVDKEVFSEIASYHQKVKDDRSNPEMKKSYRAFMDETKAQYEALVKAGYVIEPWLKEGEPYGVDSRKLREDVENNKHLYYLRSKSATGQGEESETSEDYMPFEDSGIVINGDTVLMNDLFRAVHDIMGHALVNNSFSTQGELDAYKTHSSMYSPTAQKALFLETVVYNAWYAENKNYGPRKIYDVPQSLISAVNEGTSEETSEGVNDALVYDIGGSEGGFVKAISQSTNGKVRTINLDVNPDMQKAHNARPVEGSKFVKEAFFEEYTDDASGITSKRHVPKEKADVVHESMAFQFMSDERKQFIKELKDNYVKPNGIVLLEEKILPESEEVWRANEQKKDGYKLQYFEQAAITEKAEQVLVGMKANQTPQKELLEVLKDNFQHVEEYWDAGNFKGFVASNSREAVDNFLNALGGKISSEYSTVEEAPAVESPNNIEVEINEEALGKLVGDNAVEENSKPQEEQGFKPIDTDVEFQKVGGPERWSREQRMRFSMNNVIKMLKTKFNIDVEVVNEPESFWRGKFSNGKIYINEAMVSPDTPFHEVIHPFMHLLKKENPALYTALVNDFKSKENYQEILDELRQRYPELTEEELLEEAMVDSIGRMAGEKNLEPKNVFRQFFDWVKGKLATMGLYTKDFKADMTLEDMADLILDPSFVFDLSNKMRFEEMAERYSKASPEARFDEVIDDIMRKLEADLSVPPKSDDEKKRKYFSEVFLNQLKANRKDIKALDSFIITALTQVKDISEKFDSFRTKYESKAKKSPADIAEMSNLLYEIENTIVLYDDLRPLINSMKDLFPDNADNYGSLFNYLSRQDSLIQGYKDYGVELIAEWLTPYLQKGVNSALTSGKRNLVVSDEVFNTVNKEYRAKGITDAKTILQEAVKREFKKTIRIAKGEPAFLTSWLSGVLNVNDSVSQTVGVAVIEEIQKALKKAFVVKDNIIKTLRKVRGNTAFATQADEKKFYEKYLRQADSYEYVGLKKDGTEEYKTVKRWAFHEEFYWDVFYNERRKFFEALGPRPSKNDPKFTAWENQRKKWYSENTVSSVNVKGKTVVVPKPVGSNGVAYKNPTFTALMNDELFKVLYNSYKNANDKLGGQSLKYGIVPQVSRGKNLFSGALKQKSVREGLFKVKDNLRELVGDQEQIYYAENIEGFERKTVPINFTRLLEEEDLSFNLADSVSKLTASAFKYEALRGLEPQIAILKNFINGNSYLGIEKRKALQNSAKGIQKLIKGSRKILPVEASRLNQQLDEFINDVVYGEADKKSLVPLLGARFVAFDKNDTSNNGKPMISRFKSFEDLKSYLGRPDLNFSDFEDGKEIDFNGVVAKMTRKDFNLSFNKAGNNLGIITSLTNMAINFNSVVMNVGIGNIQSFVESSGGKYFTTKDWLAGQAEYFKNVANGNFFEDAAGGKQSLLSQLLIHYEAFQGEFQDEVGKPISTGVANRLLRRDRLFVFQQVGEHQIQSVGMLAMLKAQKVQTTAGQQISLLDAWELDANNNAVLRKDIIWNERTDMDFKNTLQGVNKELNGNFSKLDKARLQRIWWGRAIIMFRKHIYNAFNARYGKEEVNYERGNVTEGYYRTFWNLLSDQLSSYVLNRKFRKDITDQEKYALRKLAADLGVVLTLLVLFKSTDDDDEDNEFSDNVAFWARRLLSDTVQYNPLGWPEMLKVVRDPSASVNTVEKYHKAITQLISDPEEVYTRNGPGYSKGELKWKVQMAKLIPVYRQVLNIQNPEDMLKFYKLNVKSLIDRPEKKEEDEDN